MHKTRFNFILCFTAGILLMLTGIAFPFLWIYIDHLKHAATDITKDYLGYAQFITGVGTGLLLIGGYVVIAYSFIEVRPD